MTSISRNADTSVVILQPFLFLFCQLRKGPAVHLFIHFNKYWLGFAQGLSWTLRGHRQGPVFKCEHLKEMQKTSGVSTGERGERHFRENHLAKSRCAKVKALEHQLALGGLGMGEDRQSRKGPGPRVGLPLYNVNLGESPKSVSGWGAGGGRAT